MDDGDVNRFKTRVRQLDPAAETGSIYGLAVSGGPDSLALLLLAHAVFPDRIKAATVDHGLRTEAAAEARFVGEICANLGIPHDILVPDIPITGNLQSSARTARYALLQNWAGQAGCDLIATAHHADDQLETMLLRLVRGSGVDGLAGVRPRNGNIIRPLLFFTKPELIRICTDAGIKPVQDPSNLDPDFDRVRMRQFLERSNHPFDVIAASRSAAALDQASQALDWMVSQLERAHITHTDAAITLDPVDAPPEILRRMLLRVLARMEPGNVPRGDTVERALRDLVAGRRCMIGAVLCQGGDVWRFEMAPPRRNEL